MVKKEQSKRQRSIRSKLMAAVCMLLVSAIMMVSSTYAWFTLSTAPEVTGITTAVGANGNLEMALLPKDGQPASITSAAGDSVLDDEARNVTWGNLVDVSDNTIYGLDKITLFPAKLNATGSTLATSMLKTPTYGADGRVSELIANTLTSYYDGTNGFLPNSEYGVRAVGTASGMTDRQLDYRNARSAANTAKAQAANQASQSLNSNGSALANIAIQYGMNSTNATFDKNDVAALRAIIDDLQEEGGVLDQIETAYIQYILAYAASAASGEADTVWTAVKGVVEGDGASLTSVTTALTSNNVTLPTGLSDAISEYNDTVAAVETADSKLDTLESTLETTPDATFTWGQIREAMEPLANPSSMSINGFAASEVKEKLGELVSSVTSQGGLRVIMGTGAGVYADIADQCGDYTASITIEKVEYQGIVLNNMAARMETDSSVTPYLDQIGTVVEAAGAPETDETDNTKPITDMYGFVIDMAFRTNAAESNLLLQVDAADRIYSSNTAAGGAVLEDGSTTMGKGASMTFKATTTDFSNDQVKALMSAIRLVFFDPTKSTNNIIIYGKLDMASATVGANGITAEIVLYEISAGGTTTTYEPITEGQTGTHIEDEDAEGGYREITGEEVGTHVAVTTTTQAGETIKTDNVIMPLTQNTATALSVLVYLDGDLVGNDDVAATAATSMTGSMNLQFASSANLVPMEYTPLQVQGTTPDADAGSGSGESGGTTGNETT